MPSAHESSGDEGCPEALCISFLSALCKEEPEGDANESDGGGWCKDSELLASPERDSITRPQMMRVSTTSRHRSRRMEDCRIAMDYHEERGM